MKNNLFPFLLTLSVAVAIASCNVKDTIYERESPTPVAFTAGIEGLHTVPMSRASGADWAAADAVGIFMVESGTATVANQAENREYRVQAAGTTAKFNPATDPDAIYYPQGIAVDFIAYYPYKSGTTLTRPLSVEISTTQTAANQPQFDLMYSADATGKDRDDLTVSLKFEHMLSKIVLNILQPSSLANNDTGLTDADLKGMAVTIKGMNTTGTFDLSDASFSAGTTSGNISPREITSGKTYDAIILPSASTTTEGQYHVEFTINPQSAEPEAFLWNMAAGTDFLSGNEYTYTVRLSRTGVTVTGEITPWKTTGNDRGEVTAE